MRYLKQLRSKLIQAHKGFRQLQEVLNQNQHENYLIAINKLSQTTKDRSRSPSKEKYPKLDEKEQQECLKSLQEASEIALYGFDQFMSMKIWFILGAVCKVFGQFKESKDYFTLARDLASERLDIKSKMVAYSEMAEAYNLSSRHKDALKCQKMLMQYAWQQNDTTLELKAYQGMAIEWFYLSNMSKCSFLFERVMSGNIDDSNLRRIIVNQLKKKDVAFRQKLTRRRDIHEWAIKDSKKYANRGIYAKSNDSTLQLQRNIWPKEVKMLDSYSQSEEEEYTKQFNSSDGESDDSQQKDEKILDPPASFRELSIDKFSKENSISELGNKIQKNVVRMMKK